MAILRKIPSKIAKSINLYIFENISAVSDKTMIIGRTAVSVCSSCEIWG